MTCRGRACLAGRALIAFFNGLGPSSTARSGPALFAASLAVLLVLLLAACSGGGGGGSEAPAASAETPAAANTPGTGSASERTATTDALVTTYRSPTCGCCEAYERYLEDEGFQVESVVMDDITEMKDDLGVPEDMLSCHTAMIGEYFVEGHVPVEAVRRLLAEQPPIDGIALPGMPSGSPGMGGEKEEPFVIYAIANGTVEEFMTV